MQKGTDFLYLQLADKIAQLIEKGVYAVGDRLPSVRELRQEHGVSISTALQVYAQLEKKGWITARERSGYFVQPNPRQRAQLPAVTAPAAAPVAVKVNEQVRRIREGRRQKGLVALDAATPAAALMPQHKLHKAMLHAIRRHSASCVPYHDVSGYEPLQRLIAQRSLTWKDAVTAADVTITNGCLEAVSLCLRAVARPGDTIAIESPTFFGLLMTIESLGMKALEIATDPVTGICLDKLENAFRKKKAAACLLVSNYNNPLGSCMPPAHKQALAQLLQRYQVPLVEDDAFGDLHHGPDRPDNIKTYDSEGLVLLCSSFSKSLAPGYRLGWAIAGRYRHKVEQLKFMTSIHTSLMPQLAIHSYLEHQRLDLHLKQLRHALALQTQQMANAIQQYFPAHTRITRPEGSFNLWVELGPHTDAWELYRLAMEQRIAIMPGTLFSSQPRYRNCLRISAGLPFNEDMAWAVQTVGRLAKRMN
ncbi:aminotransferase-like domain-containing protein [Chitinophaga japonensis]|uniref:DNA-binding transcriptional MocR family regulator n=1 Tax=Chitinophaga japonensis TaxID=104662 RepID=A0A562SSC6_CHIJA|nr:PLP-dependent aminotransferase family protein [Chitinophaga japonensis]TWI84169.1 DNA-binding transcriptional MocR family regulator [Chitinophaga japonensis]